MTRLPARLIAAALASVVSSAAAHAQTPRCSIALELVTYSYETLETDRRILASALAPGPDRAGAIDHARRRLRRCVIDAWSRREEAGAPPKCMEEAGVVDFSAPEGLYAHMDALVCEQLAPGRRYVVTFVNFFGDEGCEYRFRPGDDAYLCP